MENSFSFKRNPTYGKDFTMSCPEQDANLFQKLTFSWMNCLLWKGFKNPLELNDITDIPPHLHVENTSLLIKKVDFKSKYSLLKHLISHAISNYKIIIFLKLLSTALSISTPIILKVFLWYIQKDANEKEIYIGWILSFALFLSAFLLNFSQQLSLWNSGKLGMEIRGSLSCVIYKKMFMMSNTSRKTYSMGRILNLIGSDVSYMHEFFMNVNLDLILYPIQIALLLAVLCFILGVSGAVGFGVMLFSLSLTTYISSRMNKYMKWSFVHSDERVKMVSELIDGIRSIKQYAWEKIFLERVEEKRQLQLMFLHKRLARWIVNQMIIQSTSGFVLLVTFSLYTVLGNRLTADVAFTALTVFVNLKRPIETLPLNIQKFLMVLLASTRIQEYLLANELQSSPFDILDYTKEKVDPNHYGDVKIINGHFDWKDGLSDSQLDMNKSDNNYNNDSNNDNNNTSFNISNNNLNNSNNSLSLVKVLSQFSLDNLEDAIENHNLHMDINIDSVEDGVLKNVPNNRATVNLDSVLKTKSAKIEMVEISSLTPNRSSPLSTPRSATRQRVPTGTFKDVNFTAPKGKLTVICGQVGSGKTSLVSALIGEIYRVDGVVSRPNSISYTTQQAFLTSSTLRENILFGKPYNRDRYIKVIYACSLASDLLQLPGRDLTEIGEKGTNLSGGQKQRISLARALYSDSECFILDEPLSAVDPLVAKHLFEHCIQGMMQGKTRILVTHQLQFIPYADHIVLLQDGEILQGTYHELQQIGIDFESIMKTKKLNVDTHHLNDNVPTPKNHTRSKLDVIKKIEALITEDENTFDLIEKSRQFVQEDLVSGSMGFGAYSDYIRSGGPLSVFFIVVCGLYLISQCVFQGSDFFLKTWTQRNIDPDPGDRFYILIYFGFIGTFMCLLGLRYFLITRYTFGASRSLHHQILQCITYAPCQFFDQNPSGRILNIFSKDISEVDTQLLEGFNEVMYGFASVLVSIGMMIYLNPIISAPFFALAILYYFIQQVYLRSSREIKRMESVSRSPIFSCISESYNGISTIRAFNEHVAFIQNFQTKLNLNLRLFFYNFSTQRWIGLRLEFISSVVVLCSAVFCIYNSDANPSAAGLALTTALSVTNLLTNMVKQITDLEVKMNSIERIKRYTEIPREEVTETNASEYLEIIKELQEGWPRFGALEFRDLEMSYKKGAQPSLIDLSLPVLPQQKIGIVGRTGAGKSTIGVSLFRMVEASKGCIMIDGVDISKIGLHDLRSRLGIIPQEPFIFFGSIRANLDPLNQYSDLDVWEALEKVQLKNAIQNMPDKLDSLVFEGGDGLSTGQKQLLCLARAILKNSKIVLMDEATASLDYQTDYIIKQIIKEHFTNATVLTIAHRLDTIIDSDKILVIDKGQMVEFDSPQNLINNPLSKFSRLVIAQTH
ncbi:hypothetical protein CYY_009397 [Polysphondylium violaceum]|uniref:ABC transporter C family protein n=1 Tax=Polysphondylium violaceum TaxID=133409 RepID=A0A8J4V301_9MYCE|nr:hypothetical protein CYY_009397 [Polysphondylium violaceum]